MVILGSYEFANQRNKIGDTILVRRIDPVPFQQILLVA